MGSATIQGKVVRERDDRRLVAMGFKESVVRGAWCLGGESGGRTADSGQRTASVSGQGDDEDGWALAFLLLT
jgi:hypothetical protein